MRGSDHLMLASSHEPAEEECSESEARGTSADGGARDGSRRVSDALVKHQLSPSRVSSIGKGDVGIDDSRRRAASTDNSHGGICRYLEIVNEAGCHREQLSNVETGVAVHSRIKRSDVSRNGRKKY